MDRCFRGETVRFKEWLPLPDETKLFFDIIYAPVYDVKGLEVIGVASYLKDITEQKKAQDDLRRSEKKYWQLVKHAPVGLYEIDFINNKFITVNDVACKYSGYTEKELLEMNPAELLTPNSSQLFFKRLKRLFSGEKVPLNVEYQIKKKNGSTLWVELKVQFTYDGDTIKGATVVAHDISERKRVEDALRDRRDYLRMVLESIADEVFVHDLEGRFLLVNASACRNTGYRLDELLHMRVSDIEPNSVLRYNSMKYWAKVNDGTSAQFLSEHIRRNGTTYPVEINLNQIQMPDGKGIIALARDITERKLAEDALKKSEAKYRLIAENMSDIITTMDMELNFTYVTPSVKKLRGYTVEEALEQKIDQIMTPESFQLLSKVLAEELNLEQRGADPDRVRKIELEEYKKEGSTIWVENTGSFIRDCDQKPIGILVISRDITDRKQAENALRESENRFRTLAEMLPEAVFEADKGLKLNFVNKEAFKIFGYSQQDLDNGLYCIDMLSPEDRDKAFKNITRRLQIEEFGAVEYLALRKDGSTFPILLHANPILRKGVVDGIRGIVVDLSEIKNMEDQVRHAQKMESLGTLAGGIAHEFNNMLSIIIGNTELALDDIPEWNPAADCIQEIRKASLRAKDVVRKLLSVARKTPESRKPIEIGSIITESLDLMRKTIPTTIDIQKNIRCSTEMILGDATEINQVMTNLCTNSFHAMTEESGVIEVNLDTTVLNMDSAFTYEDLKPGDYARLTVKDTGKGIEAVFMDRLFDPYFTLNQAIIKRKESSKVG